MLIKELFTKKKPVISLEIFPPKPETPIDTILKTIDELKDLKPDYISVTYGAGGSSKSHTVQLADIIKNQYGIEALAHLTCITSTKDDVNRILGELKEAGVENVLALRGDMPQDGSAIPIDEKHYHYAKDLISHIRAYGGFSIGAACYPEGHIECSDKIKDLRHLKEKVETGADFLITQLFLDNEFYFSFKEKLDIMGIDIPVTTGIMPVINKKSIERITSLCGAAIAPKFRRILDKYEHNPEALKEAGIAYATEQIIDLLSSGVDGIHLYTMNRPEVAKKIISDISTIRSHFES